MTLLASLINTGNRIKNTCKAITQGLKNGCEIFGTGYFIALCMLLVLGLLAVLLGLLAISLPIISMMGLLAYSALLGTVGYVSWKYIKYVDKKNATLKKQYIEKSKKLFPQVIALISDGHYPFTILNFNCFKMTEEEVYQIATAIKNQPHIHTLNLNAINKRSELKITDGLLRAFGENPYLTKLYLPSMNLTEEAIQYLAATPSLNPNRITIISVIKACLPRWLGTAGLDMEILKNNPSIKFTYFHCTLEEENLFYATNTYEVLSSILKPWDQWHTFCEGRNPAQHASKNPKKNASPLCILPKGLAPHIFSFLGHETFRKKGLKEEAVVTITSDSNLGNTIATKRLSLT